MKSYNCSYCGWHFKTLLGFRFHSCHTYSGGRCYDWKCCLKERDWKGLLKGLKTKT